MEYPVKEIPGVIRALAQGSPEQQAITLSDYFLPNASFSHPPCDTPSLARGSVPLAGGIDSLWVVLTIYRWYRTLSPHIDIKVDSAAFDPRSGLLSVSLRQTFALWFIPIYKAPVRLVSVLQLTQITSPLPDETKDGFSKSGISLVPASPRSNRPKYYIASQEDLYPVADRMRCFIPGLGPFLWFVWQLYSAWLFVMGSLLFLPLYLLLNRSTKPRAK
ncbi:hypothetical protein BGZ61DRAFT_379147 [Ilyonectria robusta]|uniref:uncharacterized protein n=1 Tax=Ilyonectria robusta TaxID=1079257 RepID=UPI001E8DC6D7|nr:uncharacterized protein BGZ61DRAFT_379147 [Ilyonectria robusta]KAH8738246.1 hypothetical protein BGZ61DRAFT_379147 [Ilyonectria robusta]